MFLKLTADQELVVAWIAGPSQVRHAHTLDRGLILALFLWLDAAAQPRYVSKALDSRCFSCSGTVWKIYFFCIFRLKAELPACLFLLAVGLVKIKGFGTVCLLVFPDIA